MLRDVNTQVLASLLLVITAVTPAAGNDAPAVDWSHAQQVYPAVRGWVSDGTVGTSMEAVRVTRLVGVRVTLRMLGRTAGMGDALVKEDGDQPADLLAVAGEATGAALRALRGRMTEAMADPAGAAEVLRSLLVDLQVATDMEAIVIDAQAPPRTVLTRFNPGYHGLAGGAPGGSQTSLVWPATALAQNFSPMEQLIALVRELGYKGDVVRQLGRPGGIRLARFRVIHLVQPQRDLPVQRLIRGQIPLPTTSLDQGELESMMDGLAQHLLRRQREEGSMGGTYRPTADRWEPMDASHTEQAMVMAALGRWRHHQVRRNAADIDLGRAVDGAMVKGLRHLAGQLFPVVAPADRVAAAWTMIALIHAPEHGDRKAHRDTLAAALVEAQKADGWFDVQDGNQTRATRGDEAAAILNAWTQVYEQTRNPDLIMPMLRLYRALLRQDAVHNLAALPLLAEAEDTMRTLGLDPALLAPETVTPPAPVVAVAFSPARYTAVIKQLMDHQVVRASEVNLDDVVGGFDLEDRPPLVPALPDWRTAHGLWLLAQGLAKGGFLHHDPLVGSRLEILVRAGLASRFLAQLTFREPSAYYLFNADEVRGGLRESFWDNVMPPGVSATALLASTRLADAIVDASPGGSIPPN